MVEELFGYGKNDNEVTLENAKQVRGLKIYFDFITKAEETELLNNIDKNEWLSDLKRRVQHFGYKYDYRARRIDKTFYIGEIPDWMTFLSDRLQDDKIILFTADQAIVNEYVDNQGIASHIDCEPCFGDTIISISLEGHCVMNFHREKDAKEQEKIAILIPPRTLIVMTEEARFEWYHEIPGRKTDKFNHNSYRRRRRVSITFRKVVI